MLHALFCHTGAGMFVTTMVVGAVTVTQPFMLTRRPFIRDIIFYIAAVYCTFFMLWNNRISLWVAVGESHPLSSVFVICFPVGFILLYIFYVLVVVLGRVVFQKYKKKRLGTGDIPSMLHFQKKHIFLYCVVSVYFCTVY